ncbi:MAG: hypothetical protein V3V26_03405, partial [Candidatus Aenigmarchaeota archaeon]
MGIESIDGGVNYGDASCEYKGSKYLAREHFNTVMAPYFGGPDTTFQPLTQEQWEALNKVLRDDADILKWEKEDDSPMSNTVYMMSEEMLKNAEYREILIGMMTDVRKRHPAQEPASGKPSDSAVYDGALGADVPADGGVPEGQAAEQPEAGKGPHPTSDENTSSVLDQRGRPVMGMAEHQIKVHPPGPGWAFPIQPAGADKHKLEAARRNGNKRAGKGPSSDSMMVTEVDYYKEKIKKGLDSLPDLPEDVRAQLKNAVDIIDGYKSTTQKKRELQTLDIELRKMIKKEPDLLSDHLGYVIEAHHLKGEIEKELESDSLPEDVWMQLKNAVYAIGYQNTKQRIIELQDLVTNVRKGARKETNLLSDLLGKYPVQKNEELCSEILNEFLDEGRLPEDVTGLENALRVIEGYKDTTKKDDELCELTFEARKKMKGKKNKFSDLLGEYPVQETEETPASAEESPEGDGGILREALEDSSFSRMLGSGTPEEAPAGEPVAVGEPVKYLSFDEFKDRLKRGGYLKDGDNDGAVMARIRAERISIERTSKEGFKYGMMFREDDILKLESKLNAEKDAAPGRDEAEAASPEPVPAPAEEAPVPAEETPTPVEEAPVPAEEAPEPYVGEAPGPAPDAVPA